LAGVVDEGCALDDEIECLGQDRNFRYYVEAGAGLNRCRAPMKQDSRS
jgi:hypothetical protein